MSTAIAVPISPQIVNNYVDELKEGFLSFEEIDKKHLPFFIDGLTLSVSNNIKEQMAVQIMSAIKEKFLESISKNNDIH